MLYGVEVWGPYCLNKFCCNDRYSLYDLFCNTSSLYEKLHSKFCKLTLSVHKKSSNIGVRTELGRYPICINIISQVTQYFVNICNRDSGSIVKQMLFFQNRLYEITPRRSWFSLLYFINKHTQWKAIQNINNIFTSYVDMKLLLCSKYEQCFSNIVKDNNKLNVLFDIKKVFGISKYLTYVSNHKYRKAFTMFRISAHSFPVEVGRYRSVDRNNRICAICNCNEIGDEFHYFMKCTDINIQQLRKDFLSSVLSVNIQLEKLPEKCLFNYLLCGSDVNLLPRTAEYIHNIISYYRSKQ